VVLDMTTERERPDFEQGLAAALAEGGARAAQLICELCVDALPVTGAAITAMISPDRQTTMWATDEVAARIDELQFRLAEGPCVEAFTSAAPVLVPDIADGVHEKWPVFAAAAVQETAARGMYVLPLRGGPISIGVLDFYRDRPLVLEPDDVARALRASDAAFWAVLDVRPGAMLDPTGAPEDAGADGVDVDVEGWLADVPLERPEVYQATGMIIAQLGLSPDDALATLRAHAFVRDRPIDEVARDVVARTLRFAEEQ
jgi:ANTAR domain